MTYIDTLTSESTCIKCGGLGVVSVYYGTVGGTFKCDLCSDKDCENKLDND